MDLEVENGMKISLAGDSGSIEMESYHFFAQHVFMKPPHPLVDMDAFPKLSRDDDAHIMFAIDAIVLEESKGQLPRSCMCSLQKASDVHI